MNKEKEGKQWEPYQKKYWTENWQNSPYSMQELIDGDPWVGVMHSPLLPIVLSYLKEGAKVLEAGCGLGQWVICLSGMGYDVTGIDFSEQTIEKNKMLFPKNKFVVGDILNYQFENNCFDAVLSWGVVEHFVNGPMSALKEANRVIKKDGRLFITVPCKNILFSLLTPILYLKSILLMAIRRMLKKANKKNFHQYHFKKTQFERHVSEAGFKILKTIPMSHEVGFSKSINMLFCFGKRRLYVFNKGRGRKWNGLTPWGNRTCMLLKRISPWITPDQIFIVAQK